MIEWLVKHLEPYEHLVGYMERWWIVKYEHWFKIAVRIHHILRSDLERHLHDHPWWYISIILKGGYWEVTDEAMSIKRWYGPGSILFRKATHKHRLILPAGTTTWTLFITGPWQQDWGFFTPNGKTHWKEYLDGNV